MSQPGPFFLGKFGKKLGKEVRGVSQKAMASLMNYIWPSHEDSRETFEM
ncbi:MAG: hypothetical protein WD688_21220 [Candidatus Binatia bacterium]